MMFTQKQKQDGLTLMEVIVSLGLVAVLTLFVVGVLSRLLFSSGKTAHQAAANLLAEELLEESALAGPPTWSFPTSDRTGWVGERFLTLPGEKSDTLFRYKLEEITIANSPEDLGTFHELKITVWWWGDEPTQRADQGNLYVDAHRKVYVRRQTME